MNIKSFVELLGQATDDGRIGGWGIGYSDAEGFYLHGWIIGTDIDIIGDSIEGILADLWDAVAGDEEEATSD